MKYFLLLSPLIITIYWAINLRIGTNCGNSAKKFLSSFMVFAAIVYLSHFLYFSSFHTLYSYVDPIYQLAMLMVYPMYHIYIRLLTIDERFQLRKHIRYLIVPLSMFVIYSCGIILSPAHDYKAWLIDHKFVTPRISFLQVVYISIRIVFIVEVFMTITGNILLTSKHGYKASEYYSDITDGSTYRVKALNILIIITASSSITMGILGREFFYNNLILLGIASFIFSFSLFSVGWLGNKQKVLNPTFDNPTTDIVSIEYKSIAPDLEKDIIERITLLFEQERLYQYSGLNIVDLAQAIGTNRSYLSRVINQHYNQSFTTFVNNHRLNELEKRVLKEPARNYQLLADDCGFGSVDSLKRAVKSKHGVSFADWKKDLLQKV